MEKQVEQNQKGGLVESVTDGSWSSLGGLRVGDVMLEVNNTPVVNTGKVRDVMKLIHQDRPHYVIIKIRRGVHVRFVEIRTPWEDH